LNQMGFLKNLIASIVVRKYQKQLKTICNTHSQPNSGRAARSFPH
jgi:hypothetical protein